MNSNEQAKQAAIIKAWGEYWEKLGRRERNIALNDDGWAYLSQASFESITTPTMDYPDGFDFKFGVLGEIEEIRPKSLSGLDDNNGWERVNPDGSNIPEEVAYYEVCINGIPWGHPQPLQFLVRTFHSPAKDQLTHFKKWEPSKGPVY